MIKVITIIGARPQIIKSSAISRAISTRFNQYIEEIIVHTGQHYDDNMSSIFFEEMGIPQPKYNLNVGSGQHGVMTAKMMEGLEDLYLHEKPDAILVYGDTNSTLAGAIAASKIHIPVIHVEAGLRSFNKRMPEEINRIASDHVSTLLFTPTQSGLKNLINEGFAEIEPIKADIDNPAVYKCGDVMYDNSLYFSSVSEEKSTILKELKLETNQYVLVTIHRDGNTDNVDNLTAIFEALLDIGERFSKKIVIPIHPRTKKKMKEILADELYNRITESANFVITNPAGFLDIIALEKNAYIIVTDSGGLQKEAYFFKKPCVILRPQTEWVEIVENGNALLAGADKDLIINSFEKLVNKTDFTYPSFYGDGDASGFICKKILQHLA